MTLTKPNVPLSLEMNAADALKRILESLFAIIRAQEERIRQDDDPEGVHDFRVAARRARALVGQMRHVFPPLITRSLKRDLFYLGRMTTHLRDFDVQAQNVSDYSARLLAEQSTLLEPLLSYLQRRRLTAQRRVLRSLNSKKYARMMARWQRFCQHSRPFSRFSRNARRTVAKLIPGRIFRLFKSICKQGRSLTALSPDADFHHLRIECKKLRYVLEFYIMCLKDNQVQGTIQALTAEKLAIIIDQLKKLQDNLGRSQDATVQLTTLHAAEVMFSRRDRKRQACVPLIQEMIAVLEIEKATLRNDFSDLFVAFTSAESKKFTTT